MVQYKCIKFVAIFGAVKDNESLEKFLIFLVALFLFLGLSIK